MRIAIFHNYLDNIGGAEKVTLTLARELGADVFSPVSSQEKIHKMGFNTRVKTIGWIPTNAPFRQQAALARFRYLDISKQYDFFIIAGDWAVSAAVNHKPNIWYCYSPIREIWDYKETVRNTLVPRPFRPIYDMWSGYNQHLNRTYVQHVQRILCDSRVVQRRVKTFLGRDSDVVYPPVDTGSYQHKPAENFWLSVNRLFHHKRIELQIEAMRRLPEENLVIVGSYEKSRHFTSYAKKLMSNLPSNVSIRSWVDDLELKNLYATCKGLLATAHNEDFGLSPVEAMAAGKPVIAVRSGGYMETVLEPTTGVFVEPTPKDIAKAIQTVGPKSDSFQTASTQRANMFDTNVFMSHIRGVINGTI